MSSIKLFPMLILAVCAAEEPLYKPIYSDSISLVQATVNSILIVIALLLLLFIWYRKILPSIQEKIQTKNCQLIERMVLEPTTIVYILKIADTYQAVLVSSKNCTHLGNFPKKAIQLLTTKKNTGKLSGNFQLILDQIQKKQKGKSRAQK